MQQNEESRKDRERPEFISKTEWMVINASKRRFIDQDVQSGKSEAEAEAAWNKHLDDEVERILGEIREREAIKAEKEAAKAELEKKEAADREAFAEHRKSHDKLSLPVEGDGSHIRSFVYFLQCCCCSCEKSCGAIKIGVAKNPKNRVSEIQLATHHKLRLVGLIVGGYPTESALHERFKESRLGGEWFSLTDELADFIQSITPMPFAPWKLVQKLQVTSHEHS